MGQYHYTVNLDKHEFINPHKLGDGLKLAEQCGWSPGGTNDALHLLLAVSNGRGGGDFNSGPDEQAGEPGQPVEKYIGRWGGDRIAVVGDYSEDGDLPAEFKAGSIYNRCLSDDDEASIEEKNELLKRGPLFKDITDGLIPVMEREYETIYFGEGWRRRKSLSDVVQDWQYSHQGSERLACIRSENYRLADVIAALKAKLNDSHKHQDIKFTVEQLKLKPIRRAKAKT